MVARVCSKICFAILSASRDKVRYRPSESSASLMSISISRIAFAISRSASFRADSTSTFDSFIARDTSASISTESNCIRASLSAFATSLSISIERSSDFAARRASVIPRWKSSSSFKSIRKFVSSSRSSSRLSFLSRLERFSMIPLPTLMLPAPTLRENFVPPVPSRIC